MFPKDREAADGNKRGKKKMNSGLKPVQPDAAVLGLDPPSRGLAGERPAGFLLAGTPPPYSDEELSKQSRRQRPTCGVDPGNPG